MKVAVIKTSKKENEKRVPIHPLQISSIPEKVRENLYFEKGYGENFGVKDEKIKKLTGNILLERKELFEKFNAFIIPKPVLEDYQDMKEGSKVLGWIHSVQNSDVVDEAIKKKMTLYAFENMNYNLKKGKIHVFEKNNEMAGYCAVQHALEIEGIDGNYGRKLKASVIGLGSVSRGAIYALRGHGIVDVTVYTERESRLVSNQIPGIKYRHIQKNSNNIYRVKPTFSDEGGFFSLELLKSDIIINGTLQDPLNPSFFLTDDDIKKFEKRCLIIDVSCDDEMGFTFAHPTTFKNPVHEIGNVIYYAVDHTPSMLYNSASYEISRALFPFLEDFVFEKENSVLDSSIDIKSGKIINKEIIVFQDRESLYPYSKEN